MEYSNNKLSVIGYLVMSVALVSCQSGQESKRENTNSQVISKFAVVDFSKTKQVIDGRLHPFEKLYRHRR